MPTVELIYDSDCPNVPQAREILLRAFGQTSLVPHWQEWDRADAKAPEYTRAFGSPTVLVNGKDVAWSDAPDAACCRIYAGVDGKHHGAPAQALIAAALAESSKSGGSRRNFLALIPSVGTALAPKLLCPTCWPAYAGLLSAMGLGFINYSPYLLPLTLLFLVAVLATLAWRARTRRGFAPLALGALATTIILAGKFRFDSDVATYTGVALIVAASLWNSWPRRNRALSCSECSPNSTKNTDNLNGGVS